MKLQCPKCGAVVVIAKRLRSKRAYAGRLPDHPVRDATRTFACVDGDDTPHFFDYQERCVLSGARFTLELRS